VLILKGLVQQLVLARVRVLALALLTLINLLMTQQQRGVQVPHCSPPQQLTGSKRWKVHLRESHCGGTPREVAAPGKLHSIMPPRLAPAIRRVVEQVPAPALPEVDERTVTRLPDRKSRAQRRDDGAGSAEL
jgi:hypothetical protein